MKAEWGAICVAVNEGIVGDYADIIPELIDRVKKGFTFGIEPSK